MQLNARWLAEAIIPRELQPGSFFFARYSESIYLAVAVEWERKWGLILAADSEPIVGALPNLLDIENFHSAARLDGKILFKAGLTARGWPLTDEMSRFGELRNGAIAQRDGAIFMHIRFRGISLKFNLATGQIAEEKIDEWHPAWELLWCQDADELKLVAYSNCAS